MHEELTSAKLDIGTQLQISQVAVQTSHKARQSCLDGLHGESWHNGEHEPTLFGQEELLELQCAAVKAVRSLLVVRRQRVAGRHLVTINRKPEAEASARPTPSPGADAGNLATPAPKLPRL